MKYIKFFESFIEESRLPKIAIYYDMGVKQSTISVWSNFCRMYFETEPTQLNSESFIYTRLKQFDLVIVPGGKSLLENFSMTEEDKEGLRRYVSEGGKFAGICAGAFLTSLAFDWSLGLVPLKVIENQDETTGEILQLDFSFTKEGNVFFNTNIEKTKMYFHGGPIFEKVEDSSLKVLLRFAEGVPTNGGTKIGAGAIAAAFTRYGLGKALLISPHIEKSEPYEYLLANAINNLLRND